LCNMIIKLYSSYTFTLKMVFSLFERSVLLIKSFDTLERRGSIVFFRRALEFFSSVISAMNSCSACHVFQLVQHTDTLDRWIGSKDALNQINSRAYQLLLPYRNWVAAILNECDSRETSNLD
jgi:hypothetical protein